MEYDLTPEERRRYIVARGKTIVTACPGSGKTTSIVYKLRQLCKEVETTNKHVGVLCLSFTNKAVNEIKTSFRKMHGYEIGYPHEVATIDSFLTKNIVMPYWYLHSGCKTSPIIINDETILHNVLWHHYTTSDGQVQEACNIKDTGALPHTYKPEEINRNGCKYYQKTTELPNELYKYADKVINYRLSSGFITSSDAMNVALQIVNDYPIIAESIAQRYPYIIVDEAQDTSYNQFCLLAKLSQSGVQNLELIGDINQSIYEWRFARPDILERLTSKEGWEHIPFVNNRRSVQRVIDLYSKLVPANRRQPIVSTDVIDAHIPIIIYRYDNKNSQDVITDFENKCADNNLKEWLILTRGRSLGKILSGSKGTPEYWNGDVPYIILNAYQDFQTGFISKAIQLMAYVWSLLIMDETRYEERKIFINSKMNDNKESAFLMNVLFKLPNLNETFESWTSKMPEFLKNEFHLESTPLFKVYQRKKTVDIKALAKSRLSAYYGNNVNTIHSGRTIQTIHSSKGATTDAVLLFLSNNNSGNQISLNLLENVQEMTERHRLLYVACSRARQFLALAVPKEYPEEKLQKVLNGIEYKIITPNESF